QHFLNGVVPYRAFSPEVLRQSEGRYWCDYAYHVAPIERAHIDEMEMLAVDHGVPSFKIFMFYGGYGLHGTADPAAQRQFLMLPEGGGYDLAPFEFILRGAARPLHRRAGPAAPPPASGRTSTPPTRPPPGRPRACPVLPLRVPPARRTRRASPCGLPRTSPARRPVPT